jgi:hypothetical protein
MRNTGCILGAIHPASADSPSDPKGYKDALHSLDVASEDLSEAIPTMNDISW